MSIMNCASFVMSVFLIINFSWSTAAKPVETVALQPIQLALNSNAEAGGNSKVSSENKTGRSLMDFGKGPASKPGQTVQGDQLDKLDRLDQVAQPAKKLSSKASEKNLWQSLTIWVNQKQVSLSNTLTTYLQQFKKTNDYTFAVLLIGLSFLYGLVHAAGPGHGKVVVSSYIMANNQTMRRGIFLSFLSSFVQGTVAVSLVAIPALLFNASGTTIKKLGFHFTQLSYVLIILLGVYLLASLIYKKWKSYQAHIVSNTNGHSQNHGEHNHASHDHEHHEHHDNCGCGHSHIPSAQDVQGKWDVAKIISLVLSVGLRPCTGALYVLALALIKGVFWVGVLSVYAMALGTAMTISLVTMTVVGGRKFAVFSSSSNSRLGGYVYDFCTMGGAAIIILFGTVLLSSSFTPLSPF